MATKRKPKSSVSGGFDYTRLPGNVRQGSQAYFRKFTTQGGRVSMSDVIDRYSNLIKMLQDITPSVVQAALMPVFNRSQVYVPKKSGALAASGQLNVFPMEGGTVEAEIVYGSQEAWYAALVHEFVWLHHDAPTRAKYLQQAMEENIDEFIAEFAVYYLGAMSA